jgi:hypothetical protein
MLLPHSHLGVFRHWHARSGGKPPDPLGSVNQCRPVSHVERAGLTSSVDNFIKADKLKYDYTSNGQTVVSHLHYVGLVFECRKAR